MKNSFGNHITVTLFGESHGPSIGVVADGLAAGIPIDEQRIRDLLSLRRPVGAISTARQETDEFVFESGVFQGHTTGTPLCIRTPTSDTRSSDYEATRFLPRPSHADYPPSASTTGLKTPAAAVISAVA
jgi:chorismate synthase